MKNTNSPPFVLDVDEKKNKQLNLITAALLFGIALKILKIPFNVRDLAQVTKEEVIKIQNS